MCRTLFNIIATLTVTLLTPSLALASIYTSGQILVKPNPNSPELEINKALKGQNSKEIARIPKINVRVISVPAKAEERVINTYPSLGPPSLPPSLQASHLSHSQAIPLSQTCNSLNSSQKAWTT